MNFNKIVLDKINNFVLLSKEFDNNYQNFIPASYNYYSSINDPISHLFADIIPIIIYLRPKYTIYN